MASRPWIIEYRRRRGHPCNPNPWKRWATDCWGSAAAAQARADEYATNPYWWRRYEFRVRHRDELPEQENE